MPHALSRPAVLGLGLGCLISLVALPAQAATQIQQLTEAGQWGLDLADQHSVDGDGRYSSAHDGAGVRVYVLDTGIDASLADFGGRVEPGFDAVDGGESAASDPNGHGTHMAGLVAGNQYGIAKSATLVPVRVQQGDYTSNLEWYSAGIDWMIADHRAHPGAPAVANMSFDEEPSAALDAAVQRALDAGITVIVAAGNTGEGHGGDSCAVSPARIAASGSAAVSVGGLQQQANGEPTWYTGGNSGSCITLLAPAYNILSDVPTGSDTPSIKSGTSQATALVSGAAALLLQAHPGWTPAQVKAALVADATPLDATQAGLPEGVPARMLSTLEATPASDRAPAPMPPSTPVTTPPVTTPPVTTSPARPAPVAPAVPAPLRVVSAPAITSPTGSLRVGMRLDARPASFSPAASTVTYRWYRHAGSAKALFASSSSAVIPTTARGMRISLCMTGSRAGYASATSCSALSAAVGPGLLTLSQTPTIAGSPRVGAIVTAIPRSWGPAPVTLRYQWYRVNSRGTATAIPGGTTATHRLVAADKGLRVKVLVTGARSGYTTRSAWSVASVPIHA